VGSNYVRSDLSMTLFLSDPDSYDGGELTFDGPFGPVAAKAEAGAGILYPTGARHSVAPITRGARYAAIFWMQSMFSVEGERRAVMDARRLLDSLGRKAPGSEEFNLAQDSFYNLCRIFASV
jgi:PKHD-type hydroxylase